MTKAVLLPLGFILLLAAATPSPAQTSSATSSVDVADNEAVLRQANTIVLREKLVAAKAAETRGELVDAAKLYQEAAQLAQLIGSGIDPEVVQTLSGLARTRLTLARQDQEQRDFVDANKQIMQVLNYDPKNPDAQAMKRQNDQLIALNRGKMPDTATLEEVPLVGNQKTDAATLVQDGKLLYEMGKLEEAEVKLNAAIKVDPDNVGAFYYLNLIKQAEFSRSTFDHTVDTQDRMQQVEKQWVLPKNANFGMSNPFATTNLIYTGPGRQAIESKLNRIRLDNVAYDGLPLSEVLRNLSEQAKIRDPEKVGINFLINPNTDPSAAPTELGGPGGAGGFPGEGRPAALDPATGLPLTTPAAGAAEQVDVNSINIKLNLSDVSLSDVLDAIVLVADHPIEYAIHDYAIVFTAKSPDSTPPLFMRTFKVDANTFFQGLESVNSTTFGAAAQSSGGAGGGGGGGGGGSSGGQNAGTSVIPVVDMSPGASQLRSTQGGSQGGGGGGGGGGGATGATGGTGTGPGATGAIANSWAIGSTVQNGGVNFLTIKRTTDEMSMAVRNFFNIMGVNLSPPKNVFFNDRLGLLFVRASESDLDTIERAIEVLNQIAPQVHIKSRFIEVQQTDSKSLGFDWYLGQFGNTVALTGGTSPSLNVPVTSGNAAGLFPGTSAATAIAPATTDGLVTGGLQNTGPTVATITGILTNPNFQVAIHALEQRQGVENLAEPEVTTTSGRQTQMRATSLITVIIGETFQSGATGGTGVGTP